jgi:Carboxypeptidase regulatory-like domain
VRTFTALAFAGAVATVACGGSSPTSPSSLAPATFSLSGHVTDSTNGAGIVGATVSIAGGPNAGKSATTDSSGHYGFAALEQSGFVVNVTASNYLSQAKGVTLTSNQTLSFQLEPVGPVFSGVRYDDIQVAHEFVVGSPVPTQNQASTYCCWPLPVWNAGSFMFDLALFPPNILPSGGSSNILSKSEMVLVGLKTSPATGTVTFQWHKAVNQDVIISTYSGLPSYLVTYSYIGRFTWEIAEAGSYYVVVGTPWGEARLDFLVTNSAAAGLRTPNETILLAPRRTLKSGAQTANGKGGGFGAVVRTTRRSR